MLKEIKSITITDENEELLVSLNFDDEKAIIKSGLKCSIEYADGEIENLEYSEE